MTTIGTYIDRLRTMPRVEAGEEAGEAEAEEGPPVQGGRRPVFR
jgi:hypothetical protein